MQTAYFTAICMVYLAIKRPDKLQGKNILYAVPGLVAAVYMIAVDLERYSTMEPGTGGVIWFILHCVAAGIILYFIIRITMDELL